MDFVAHDSASVLLGRSGKRRDETTQVVGVLLALDGDEVEAEFESATHNSKVTVRLVNGAPSASVRERDDDDRVSDDNSSDDNSGHGGGSGHGSESNDDHGGRGRG